MANPAAHAEEQRLAARLSGLEARQYAALRDDPAAAGQLRDAIEQANLELERASAKLQALELHAGAAGRLVMPRQRDLAGSFVHRGDILAYIVTDEPALVRVAVPEARAALLRESAPRVEVRFAEAPAAVHMARLARDSLAAVERLPSAALSDTNGGPFVTDPADQDHRTTLAPVVTMDVLLADMRATWLGERAWVRFEHGYRPLLSRWARHLQAFLQGAPARVR
jgi:putative peptide zinc metalloprotease protein